MPDDAPSPIPYATPVPRRRSVRFWFAVMAAAVLFVIGLLLAVVAYQSERAARAEAVAARAAAAAAAARAAVQQAAAVASTAPTRFAILSHSAIPLPGMKDVVAHVDEISSGQVALTLTHVRKQLIPRTTMHEGDLRQFTIGSTVLVIELVEMKSLASGDVVAVFEVRAAGAASSSSFRNAR
jgi:hypothetical protein